MKKPIVTKRYRELAAESSRQRVLGVLYRYPEKEFSLSDLAREARVAKPHIGKTLNNLLSEELITIVKLSKIWRIKANQRSEIFTRNKMIFNLHFVVNSGLVGFLDDYFEQPKAIILFGSFRKGEDISGSDIDIAIEVESGEYETIGLRELADFEKWSERRIQLHLFSRKAVDLHVFNNIANGIVLSGFLEVRP